MKNLIILILSAFGIIGCSACVAHKEPFKASIFTKGEIFTAASGESTPLVFNGRLLTMTSTLSAWNSFNKGTVQIYDGANPVSKVDTTFSLASPIVDKGVLYVIGSKNWDKISNSFYMISTTDLKHWTPEQEIIAPVQNVTYYNNSVVKADNRFVMSYEFCRVGSVCFSIGFKESFDMIHWTEIGAQFRPFEYVACPSLKYLNGTFYMFYGSQRSEAPACETKLSKSTDLKYWTDGGVVLTPLDNFNEKSICDSDLDFVEFNGKLEAMYLEGDQKTWFNLRRASFKGTLQNLVDAVYK